MASAARRDAGTWDARWCRACRLPAASKVGALACLGYGAVGASPCPGSCECLGPRSQLPLVWVFLFGVSCFVREWNAVCPHHPTASPTTWVSTPHPCNIIWREAPTRWAVLLATLWRGPAATAAHASQRLPFHDVESKPCTACMRTACCHGTDTEALVPCSPYAHTGCACGGLG